MGRKGGGMKRVGEAGGFVGTVWVWWSGKGKGKERRKRGERRRKEGMRGREGRDRDRKGVRVRRVRVLYTIWVSRVIMKGGGGGRGQ